MGEAMHMCGWGNMVTLYLLLNIGVNLKLSTNKVYF